MGKVLLVSLGTGTILPSFQAEGNTLVDIEKLQRVINREATLVAVHFSILAETSSLPTDLVVSRLIRVKNNILCTEQFFRTILGDQMLKIAGSMTVL